MSDLRTRVGGVPPDWQVRRFGEVLTASRLPVAVNKSDRYREIGIRSHGKGIFHKEPISGAELGNKRVFWVEPDRLVFNIVFAWERAVAVTSMAEKGMIASHRFPTFRPADDGAVDVEFLRRFFLTDRGAQLLADASPGGAGRNRTLNQRFLADTPVPVPPLPEQRKIAAVLSAVDEVIEKTEAVIESLQALKKAMMQELLTRGLPGRHTRFKQTEIGEVPAEWKVEPLGSVASVFNGRAAGTGGTWLRAFKTKHVYDGMVRLDQAEFARDEGAFKVAKDLHLRSGDTLTPNMAHGTIGRVAYVPYAGENWATDGQVMVLRATDARALNPRFLFEFISSAAGRRRLLDAEKGSVFGDKRGQTHLYPNDVKAIPIPLPSSSEQQAISNALASLDAPLITNRDTVTELKRVKAGLMSILLTGELRVTPDEDAA